MPSCDVAATSGDPRNVVLAENSLPILCRPRFTALKPHPPAGSVEVQTIIDSQYVFDHESCDLPAPTEFFPCRQGNAAGSGMMRWASSRCDEVCEYCGAWLERG
jgi:hypothetical protein